MTTRKQRAHDTERLVARWFATRGWPYAEPVGAGRDGTDVTGMPGLLVEVKARRDLHLTTWLKQHESWHPRPGEPCPRAFIVHRPDGYGPERIAAWPVTMRLDDFTALLHDAGYGTGEDS
jgi:hypothetical protein